MTDKRYRIIDDSVSYHCCFTHTVVDAQRSDSFNGQADEYRIANYGYDFATVCETWSAEDAQLICDALNEKAERGMSNG